MLDINIIDFQSAKILKALCSAMIVLPLLSGCFPERDLQGVNPQEYYTKNPIENKVEVRHTLLIAKFDNKNNKLIGDDDSPLSVGLRNINPKVVDSIVLQMSSKIKNRENKIHYTKKMLRGFGYDKAIKIVNNDKMPLDEVIVDITHVAVITPDCPDWKKSPVTTFSNTLPANYGCASTVNLGLMIDDPRDLVYGRDSRAGYVQRAGKAISDYNSGEGASAVSAAPSSSASTTSK